MSYKKQEFRSGQTLFASQLNAMDTQIAKNEELLSGKQEVVEDLATIRSGAAKGATSVQPADLAPYATTEYVDKKIASISPSGSADSKTIDLVMFMGQSNMAGRGIVNAVYPESAPIVPEGAGYEFKAISDPTKLYHLEEPFGENENNPTSGVSEDKKTGSMVSAFANSYFRYTGVPIVGVSCSKGGTGTDFWVAGGAALNDAIARHNTAREWLLANDYTIRHDFMVWCQGETDATQGVSDDVYTSRLKGIIEAMMAEGIEKCFVVRIGRYKGSDRNYDNMIALQTKICKDYENAVLVSTDFAALTDLLKDEQHFVQQGYNITGTHAGIHTAFFIENGIAPCIYDKFYENLYIPYPVDFQGEVSVDDSLSTDSTNPVQNKVLAAKIKSIEDTLLLQEKRIEMLEGGSGVEYCNVTYALSNVTSSTTISKAIKGSSFSTILSAAPVHSINSVIVTMGGSDITSECYSDSVISIAEVTGDIVITASATEVEALLNLDFTQKSLDEYVALGVFSKNGNISSVHSAEGDLFSIVDTANLALANSLTFPTNFEIYLKMKTTNFDNSIDDTGLGGLSIFTANGNRPMINLRAPNTGTVSPHTEGLALQSRLVSSGGDNYTIWDVTIPLNDGKFHDVVIHYEGGNAYMSVDGVKSGVVSTGRTSNTVTHMLGYRNNYNFNNVLLAALAVYEI